MKILECNELSIGYGDKYIVENLTICLNSGDYLCILGENGSGKTTLMRSILGLCKPLSGEIKFLNGLNSNEIGYLPQQSAVQRDFPASVLEVVLSGTLNKNSLSPFYSKTQRKLAEKNMRLLGIEDLSHECYRELSGGQQQRVLLARALCASTKLLVLDEPTTGLDPQITQEMYSTIADLNSNGISVIMVTHDTDSAVKYASHILHLAHKPKFFGTVANYLQSDVYKTAQKRRAAR